jgi:choline-glycine betaine transporter
VDDTTHLHTAEAEETRILGELKTGVQKRRHALRKGLKGLDRTIFAVTAALVLTFIVWGFADTAGLSATSTAALNWVLANTGWVFVLLSSLFLVYVLWIALGRFGAIPLGRDGERPEFRTTSWIAMMFACGMGIGLMFYGVAEPLYHYISPPPSTVDGQTAEAIETAMATTLFHWTLHPWAIYAVVGLAIGYSTFAWDAGTSSRRPSFRCSAGVRWTAPAASSSTYWRSFRPSSVLRHPWGSVRCRLPAACSSTE